MIRLSAALATLVLLCGCMRTENLPHAASQFDGTYVGHTRLLRGSGFRCGIADLPTSIVVGHGRFDYPFQVDPPTAAPLQVQLFLDGTFDHWERYMTSDVGRFYPLQGIVSVTGKVRNGTLVATEDDMRCTRRSVLSRIGSR